jgi:type IV secretion system protein VirB1
MTWGVGVLLPAAVFISLASSCAPSVAPETLAAVAETESHLDPLAIHDNTERRSYQPGDTASAIGLAHRLIAEGHSVDLGLMQINSGNSGWLGLTVEDAFEPCRSIAAGAAVLTAYSRYNTGSPLRGFANHYVARVLIADRQLREEPAATPRPNDPPPSPSAPNPFARPVPTGRDFIVHPSRRK